MSYAAAFKTYCVRPDAAIVPTLEITWPGDWPAGRYSSSAFAVAGLGQFVEAVSPASFGDITDGYEARTTGLTQLETTVTLIDKDRSIMRILEGPYECRRARAVACWGSPGLARADWETLLDGIIDRWAYHDGCLVDLTIRTDARWLDGRAREVLSPAEWANLPDASRGIYMPNVFGSHDGQNITALGFVPTVMVRFSAGALRWDLVAHGAMSAVPRVYLNGAADRTGLPTLGLKTVSVHYSIAYPIVGGKLCTVIQWLGGSIPAVGDTVQCDVDGVTNVGAGGGTLVTNPVTQMRLWLVNHGWGRWLAGAYLSEASSPLDSASWSLAEAYAALHGLEGAFRVGGTAEPARVEDEFKKWLDGWRIFRAWWTPAGKIGLRAFELTHPGVGTGDEFDLVRKADFLSRPEVSDDVSGLASRVSLTHLFEAASGKAHGALDVQDLSQDEQATENVRMEFSAARF
jgi:hypothetical protein